MQLRTNEAGLDRLVRIVVGIALAVAAYAGAVAAPWLYVAWLVAAILVVTGAVGFCPIYAVLRTGTKRALR
jgi:hypothetical protein